MIINNCKIVLLRLNKEYQVFLGRNNKLPHTKKLKSYSIEKQLRERIELCILGDVDWVELRLLHVYDKQEESNLKIIFIYGAILPIVTKTTNGNWLNVSNLTGSVDDEDLFAIQQVMKHI